MHKLVLVRHGESKWNKMVIFTGWVDVDITVEGFDEAHLAALLLKKEGYTFDVAFTSLLKRAIRTLWIILDDLNLMWIPVHRSWRLNERHYGALQGLKKSDLVEIYGEEKVFKWRRGYDTRPPSLDKNDPRYPGNDPRYQNLAQQDIPLTESLKDTMLRVIPYWQKDIAPTVKSGKRVIVSASGNSIRAFLKYLDNIPDDQVAYLNIPNGIPLVYELDDNLKPIRNYFLGDPEAAKRAQREVASQA